MLEDHAPDPSSSPSLPFKAPPHLEARFRRRRRGTHSPSSASSSHLTSTHLATTRRQTLLDARKSHLRARLAHIERVRRSRAVSHAEVSERLLALEASMSAAQKSRDAILAKIASGCASEVQKAKERAEETRRKREEDKKRVMLESRERLQEAEKRRQEVLKERGKRRSRSGSNGREEAMQRRKEEAARRIQTWWRKRRDEQTVEGFKALGIRTEIVEQADFIEISARLMEAEVLKATGKLLRRLGFVEGTDTTAVDNACRCFLSAFLILTHPTEVLSMDGDMERDLILRSRDLLIEFQSFLSSPTFPPRPTLQSAWGTFRTAFNAWKSRDSEIFISTMVAQYAELDLIWQKVKDDTTGGVADDFKEGIRDSQLMLLVRIRRLAGDRTRDLIRKAVKETRKARLPKKSKRDTRPRETPAADSADAISTPASTNATASTVATVEKAPPSAAPPTPQPNALSSVLRENNAPSRRQIIHEMAIDPSWRLTPRPRSQLESMIESAAKRAFWDTMKADIASGQLSKWIPALAETVREKLLRLLDPKTTLYRAVLESIDVDLIRQQCDAGVYDHEKLLSYVLDLLPKICSPARDDDVAALRATTGEEYTARLQKLMDVLEAMQLDHANFLLMVGAPRIISDAIPHEKQMFAADLAAGRTKLDNTRKWLTGAKNDVPSNTSAKEIHLHAFLNLLFDPTPLKDEEIPETLHLDHDRIKEMRKKIYTIIIGSALTLTIKTLLRRDVRSGWKDLQQCVVDLLSKKSTESPPLQGSASSNSDDTASIAQSLRDFISSTTALPTSTLNTLQSTVSRLLTRSFDDPVVKVMAKRIRGFVRERLTAVAAGNGKEMARLAASGGEEMMNWGLPEWVGEVGEVTDKVRRWREVDLGAMGVWYDEILSAEDTDTAVAAAPVVANAE